MRDDNVSSVDQELLDLLDKEKCGINMTGLVNLLPQLDNKLIKNTIDQLYVDGKVNRLSIMGAQGRYFVYFSLYVRTANGYQAAPEAAEVSSPTVKPPTPEETLESSKSALTEAFEKLLPTLAPVSAVPPDPELSPEQAQQMIQHLEWDLSQPERRRAPTVMQVIDQWNLPYRLSRIVEIVAGGRRGLSKADATLVGKLARASVRSAEGT